MSAEQIAGVLAEHADWSTTNDTPDGSWELVCYGCKERVGQPHGGPAKKFAAHQAAILAPLIVAAQAEALREAADEPLPAPKNGQTSGFRAWLRTRATHLEGRALVAAIHDRKAQG